MTYLPCVGGEKKTSILSIWAWAPALPITWNSILPHPCSDCYTSHDHRGCNSDVSTFKQSSYTPNSTQSLNFSDNTFITCWEPFYSFWNIHFGSFFELLLCVRHKRCPGEQYRPALHSQESGSLSVRSINKELSSEDPAMLHDLGKSRGQLQVRPSGKGFPRKPTLSWDLKETK